MVASIELETCEKLGCKERKAPRLAATLIGRNLHLTRMERHADRAWSLAEAVDGR